jgi:predicted NAD/FAD-dependent oxidoreductase
LLDADFQVTVFDKGRAVGGRMSSKRTESGYLDMGAQYFTARSAEFQGQVKTWLDAGCAEIWNCTTAVLNSDKGYAAVDVSADQQRRYIGIPSMQAPVKALLAGIPVVTGCRIDSLLRQRQGWSLLSDAGARHNDFDAVVLTMPPVQAQQLLAQSGLADVFVAQDSLLEPCWAVALRADVCLPVDAIFCEHTKLRFISHQAEKSGRFSCYILHFNATFSGKNLEQTETFWFRQAIDILRSELGIDEGIEPVTAHRWLYASQNAELTPPGIIAVPRQQLWLGGDWSYGGRVENAYLAGLDLAGSVIHHSQRTNVAV